MPRQNTSPADYPRAVLQQIENLAQNIVIARKRRGESQAQWAKRLGVSQPTMARIERGDPSVAMASYVMCMWLVNQAQGLADLIAPIQDHAALEREVSKVQSKRQRVPGTNAPNLVAAQGRPHAPALAQLTALSPLPPAQPAAPLAVGEPEPSLPAAKRRPGAAPARNEHAAGLAALLGKPADSSP